MNTPSEDFIALIPLPKTFGGLSNGKVELSLIPARFDWDDLGSWKSIYDRHPKDTMKNAVVSAELCTETAARNLVKTDSNKKVVMSVLRILSSLIPKVLMICPMGKNQDVKDISVDALKKFNQRED